MSVRIFIPAMILASLIFGASSILHAADLTPKEVYQLKQQALEKMDCDAFCKYVTAENVAGIKQAKDPKQMLVLIRTATSPVEYQVIREEIKGNQAFLYLKGKAPNPKSGGAVEAGYGKAVFNKEAGGWKFYKEAWQKEEWK